MTADADTLLQYGISQACMSVENPCPFLYCRTCLKWQRHDFHDAVPVVGADGVSHFDLIFACSGGCKVIRVWGSVGWGAAVHDAANAGYRPRVQR